MLNGDPRDGSFYPTLTPMMDSYILAKRIKKISEIFAWAEIHIGMLSYQAVYFIYLYIVLRG